MPEHARIRLADREPLCDFEVTQRFDVAEANHVARTLRERRQTIFELHRVGSRRIFGRLGDEHVPVLGPKRGATLANAGAIEAHVATDSEHETRDARRVFDRVATQRFDECQEHVLRELVDRFARTQSPACERVHCGREALASSRFRSRITPGATGALNECSDGLEGRN